VTFDRQFIESTDRWLGEDAPGSHVAVSSRVRYARNLAGFPFCPHARPEVKLRIRDAIDEGLTRSDALRDFSRVSLRDLEPVDRTYLKESRLISKEMEREDEHLAVYLSSDAVASILVNEEDHLRLQVIAPGLQVEKALGRLNQMDEALGKVLNFAWSSRYGFLTACPSNVGTGYRASVMLHLPGLTLLQEIESSLQGIAHHGLTVRGFYGENTEYAGDFYQVSNEITLGRTVEQINQTLMSVIERIVEREQEGRLNLFKYHAAATNDSIWRSFALLAYARKMDSVEAMRLLSRIRLGIDQGYFSNLDHKALNRMVLDIQPAHLERRRAEWGDSTSRDEARARFLREKIQRSASQN
jgi:protein arginine kinase